jgi:peroxiredoxin family protein/TusA-related sulfurtransferase
MQTAPQTIDCRGMRCPAPILQLSKASRKATAPHLRVLADDGDFPTDLRAWCESTGARLDSLSEKAGVFQADIVLAREGDAPAAPDAASSTPAEAQVETIDCSGMRCPAPILAIAKAHKSIDQPTCLRILATDGDFPVDLEAWCQSTGSKLLQMNETAGSFEAFVGVRGLDELPAGQAPTPSPAAPPSASDGALDVRGESAKAAFLKIGQHSMDRSTFTFLAPPDPALRQQLEAWATALGVGLSLRMDADALHGTVGGAVTPVTAPTTAPAVAPATSPVAAGVPRENKATLLVLHNDFEPLMAALMVANASAAQGMKVEIYFSFWGVNVLRGPRSTPVPSTELEKPSLLKKMMKMMMPAGPDRQQMSKMNFGGVGVGMMKHFMKQDNILSMRQLMEQAAEMDVKFIVCTMSMGLMGVSKADLMDLPNIEFGGVTAFSGSARTAATSMVF